MWVEPESVIVYVVPRRVVRPIQSLMAAETSSAAVVSQVMWELLDEAALNTAANDKEAPVRAWAAR